MRLVEREREQQRFLRISAISTVWRRALSNAGYLYTVCTLSCPAILSAHARNDPFIRLPLLSHGKTAVYPLRDASLRLLVLASSADSWRHLHSEARIDD